MAEQGASGHDSAVQWVRGFYERQYDWAGWRNRWADVDSSVTDPRVDAVRRLAGSGPKRVLELGSGTGTTAANLAHAGHDVVAIELLPDLAENAGRLAREVKAGSLRAVAGDFYEVEVEGPFDVVAYFDGFGIGSDEDHRRLLRRIASWLHRSGHALVDVLTPWYWATAAGSEEEFPPGTGVRYRDDFDVAESRMTERMWRNGREDEAVTQSIRCYSPADLRLLVEGTGLALTDVEWYVDQRYGEQCRARDAMLFLARLSPG